MNRYIDADELWNNRPRIPEGKSIDYGAGFSECMWGFSKEIKKQIENFSVSGVEKRILPICAVRKFPTEFANEHHKKFIKRQIAIEVVEHLIENGFIRYKEDTEGGITTILALFNIVDERSENGKS